MLGTNFVNLSLVLPGRAVYPGAPVIAEFGRFEVLSPLLRVLLTGVHLVGLLEHRNPVVLRTGYDSLAVLLIFAAGLACSSRSLTASTVPSEVQCRDKGPHK